MTTADTPIPPSKYAARLKVSGLNGRNITTIGQAAGFFVQRASVRMMVGLLIPAVVLRALVGRWSWWDLSVPVLILALQPFTEWVIHIKVLHFMPRLRNGKVVDLPAAASHRFHHLHPHDPKTSFVPVRDMFSLLLVVTALSGAIYRSVPLVLTALIVALLVFLTYEWTHFLIHTAVPPRWKYYKHLVVAHRNHHFRNENYWLGVTMTFGDRVLGTAPAKHEVPLSPTARTLGVETR